MHHTRLSGEVAVDASDKDQQYVVVWCLGTVQLILFIKITMARDHLSHINSKCPVAAAKLKAFHGIPLADSSPNRFGNFKPDTIDVLRPGPGEVLVKIYSAAVNPLDLMIKKYDSLAEGYPVVIGGDIAGDIEELGEGVTNVSVGDRM